VRRCLQLATAAASLHIHLECLVYEKPLQAFNLVAAMSKLTILSFCVCCGYLSIYFAKASASDPFSFPHAKAFVLSLLIYVPLQLTWSFYLYPNYFSPLFVLPQAPVGCCGAIMKSSSNQHIAIERFEGLLPTQRAPRDIGNL
jgi:hypothetical protein